MTVKKDLFDSEDDTPSLRSTQPPSRSPCQCSTQPPSQCSTPCSGNDTIEVSNSDEEDYVVSSNINYYFKPL